MHILSGVPMLVPMFACCLSDPMKILFQILDFEKLIFKKIIKSLRLQFHRKTEFLSSSQKVSEFASASMLVSEPFRKHRCCSSCLTLAMSSQMIHIQMFFHYPDRDLNKIALPNANHYNEEPPDIVARRYQHCFSTSKNRLGTSC